MGDLRNRVGSAVGTALTARTSAAVADALNSIAPGELAEFFHVTLDAGDDVDPIGEGLPASPGAATGRIALTAEAAILAAESDQDVILVRTETSPDDVLGMQVSKGILTTRGGMVSHAAVVARGWGIPAVVGSTDVDIQGETVTIRGTKLRAGDVITIDGGTGRIYVGALATQGSAPPPELDTLLAWADTVARGHVQVRVNADTEGDACHGRRLGAQGIGLCRTEHMFLAHDRLPIVRRFILSADAETEAAALAELEDAQTTDFEQLLEAMDTLPVTVRLLDPPLHEFLPNILDLTARHARGELTDIEQLEFAAVRRLHETNPMIGTRGVRLGVVRPGLYEMQVRALCKAAAELFARGKRPHVEIMIPLVVDAEELRIARSWVHDVLDEIGHPELTSTVVTVGAMIETPRAALTAAALAEHADFFSFGTNDLTQMTYAFSRDDVEAKLLPAYQALGIISANPFAALDQEGVGELVRIGCDGARRTKPAIKLGVCGEHAGHPESADFLVRLGIDSVSCSPFRVPMARLGVAQALLACGRVRIEDVTIDFGPGDFPTDEAAHAGLSGDSSDMDEGAVADIDEALVLHVLRVRGFVTPQGFAASLGVHPAELLDELVAAGYVNHIEKRDMYNLLPAGRERHEALLGTYAAESVRSGLAPPYERFLDLNDQFKQLCTDWQIRGDAPNDHVDVAYDADCVARLVALNVASRDVIAAMATCVPRIERYNGRLDQAAECAATGDTRRFTGVMCESYHDIWMELHEDLIVMQGIERAAEGNF
jgi:phosphoenolpyruvate-protein kinase (PTS system EI component)